MNNRLLLARRYSWACVNVIFLVKQKIFFARKRLSSDSLRIKRFKVVRSSRKSTKPQQLSLFAQLEWQSSHEYLNLQKHKNRVAISLEYNDREITQNTYLKNDEKYEAREAMLAENREESKNLILLGDEGLDIEEYDSNAFQRLNDINHTKYLF